MPNGKIHDHPISDLLIHGRHPFPREIEALVLRLHALDPKILHDLDYAPFDWEAGKFHQHAIHLLTALIACHSNPDERRRAIETYRAATRK
jgi:hypothetical protein